MPPEQRQKHARESHGAQGAEQRIGRQQGYRIPQAGNGVSDQQEHAAGDGSQEQDGCAPLCSMRPCSPYRRLALSSAAVVISAQEYCIMYSP